MLLFNNPISSEKADRLISVLDVPDGANVLDVGCGRGEFLIRVIESAAANGVGIDIDADSIAAARQNAAERIPEDSCSFCVANIQTESLEPASFDLAICIGSTHAFGAGDAAYPNTIDAMRRVVRPHGKILIGEGYWKKPPDPEYLKLIGDPVGIYHDHAENISFAEARGLVPLYAVVSNDDEWDHFEWSHKMMIEHQAAHHQDDPAWTEKRNRSRRWRNGYLRWGRDTMGFGFYVFGTPNWASLGA